MKMTKETWMQGQCQEVEVCLRKNNRKKAYQLVLDLTIGKHGKSKTIQDKSGKCLTEENEILNRWTEICSDLYNCNVCRAFSWSTWLSGRRMWPMIYYKTTATKCNVCRALPWMTRLPDIHISTRMDLAATKCNVVRAVHGLNCQMPC